MVMYSGTATGLGEYHEHKPSHQASTFSGINYIQFNPERTKITEILGAAAWGGCRAGSRVQDWAWGVAWEPGRADAGRLAGTHRGVPPCSPSPVPRIRGEGPGAWELGTAPSPASASRSLPPTTPTQSLASPVFRSAFVEDRIELSEREMRGEGGFRELRLRRLV